MFYYVYLLSGLQGKKRPVGWVAYDKRHRSSTAKSPSRLRWSVNRFRWRASCHPIKSAAGIGGSRSACAPGPLHSQQPTLSGRPTCPFRANMRHRNAFSGGWARRLTPAGFFNRMERLSLLRCSLYRASGADLCEHRQHVEVVRGALHLTPLDLDHLAGRHLDRLVRWRNGACRCL
jgi:hypothetical protein